MRLRRSDPAHPGWSRRRRGRGFAFFDTRGRQLADGRELTRLRELVIPPAWRDVWICPDPYGHIQATGVDAAGRRQYLYHDVWRRRRDEEKFDHALAVARCLPRLRRRVAQDLGCDGLGRDLVLATMVRLIDLGLFRVGSDRYAAGDGGTYGVSTLQPEHVRVERDRVVFRYPAKGGVERVCAVTDGPVCAVLRRLRRREAGERLFRYRDRDGWHEVRSDDVNGYLRDRGGVEMSAKDFRTWHATVLGAALLARTGPPPVSDARRRRTVAAVMREVADQLGNTPTVARASYVDPRVVELYHRGVVARLSSCTPGAGSGSDPRGLSAAERSVLRMLREHG